MPTCGPPLILPPALKRWGPPRRQGLCSHLAHLWATFVLPPTMKRWGSPWRQGLCSHLAHLCATYDCAPHSEAVGIPQRGKVYVAALPTCGPLLILAPPYCPLPSFEAKEAHGEQSEVPLVLGVLGTVAPLQHLKTMRYNAALL